jgi:hypothetical protein
MIGGGFSSLIKYPNIFPDRYGTVIYVDDLYVPALIQYVADVNAKAK